MQHYKEAGVFCFHKIQNAPNAQWHHLMVRSPSTADVAASASLGYYENSGIIITTVTDCTSRPVTLLGFVVRTTQGLLSPIFIAATV